MPLFVALAVVMVAATLGGPVRANVLIGMAGPMAGKEAWFGEQMERGASGGAVDTRPNLRSEPYFRRTEARL